MVKDIILNTTKNIRRNNIKNINDVYKSKYPIVCFSKKVNLFDISIKRFLKDKDAIKHYPAEGEGTLSGVIIETDTKTGLAKKVTRVIDGGF